MQIYGKPKALWSQVKETSSRNAGRGPAPHQQLAGVVGQVPDLPWHFFTPSQSPGTPGGISFSLARAVSEDGPDKPTTGPVPPPETEKVRKNRSNAPEGRQHCLPHMAAKPLGGGWGRRFRLPADSFTPSEALPPAPEPRHYFPNPLVRRASGQPQGLSLYSDS
jgi:hypothetical protein